MHKFLFPSFLMILFAGCQSTESTAPKSVDPLIAQPTAQATEVVWRAAEPVPVVVAPEPVEEVIVVEVVAVEPVAKVAVAEVAAEVAPVAVEVSEPPVETMPAKVALKIVPPKEVARVTPDLPGGALKTLVEADALLTLSDDQYNDLVAVLEARTVEWKTLMANKNSMDSANFEAEKSRIFGGYSKQMLAIFTKEQSALWRKR